MNCYYQAPQKRTCSDECNSVQKGKWNSATGDCQVKSALTSVCLVSDKQNNPQLRKLSDTDVSGASPPPNSAGCIWDSKSASFVPTKYTPVTYGSISKQSFNVQLVSGKDPWYLGTLLTKGCNLKTTPSMCFGLSPASLGSRGLILLIVGLLILCCPCITWRSLKKSLVARRRITQAQRKPPRINRWPSHHSRCNNREGICGHHK